jgi:hypothetical protein
VDAALKPIFVAYVPALDRRRIDPGRTPFVASLLARFPSVRLRTHPTTELFPTLISGVDPHEHEIWQVSAKSFGSGDADGAGGAGGARRDWREALPDWLTSTAQCVRHAFDSSFDLPVIPWRRRRRFTIHRMKYTRRAKEDSVVRTIGGYPTVFGLLKDRARYRITTKFADIPRILSELPDPRLSLDFLEFYAFDLLSHWNLDRPQLIDRHLAEVDRFLEGVAERCARAGTRFVLLVDHGQELVRETIDLRSLVRRSGAAAKDVLEYIEVGVARFWFATDAARRAVRRALDTEPRIHVRTHGELCEVGLDFPDARFGEIYAIARHGAIFFPHDFYHPLANLYMGITKPKLWRRVLRPVHRGAHGQLPGHPAEEGYVVLCDEGFAATRESAPLTDFAPTVLDLLGKDAPNTMKGTALFRSRNA